MLNTTQTNSSRNIGILIKLLPILSFIIPFIILYYLYPNSFEETWKGRTYYLFFIWLVFLETILSWNELQTSKINKLKSKRTIGFIVALLLPTIYVVIANFYGLNTAIEHLYTQYMGSLLSAEEIKWFVPLISLSIEYLVYGAIFIILNIIIYGKRGLINFAIPTSLLFVIGVLYTLDNFYPYGRLTLLQFPALPTATLSANVLNLMGYRTRIWIETDPHYGWMPFISAWNPKNFAQHAEFGIGWPCAGIESLLLYTITILLFLKKSGIPLKQMLIYFIFGAIVTYFINVLRIATIFIIAINTGVNSLETQRFHEYYGQLYSITWIIAYPLIILGSRFLWRKIKNRKLQTIKTKTADLSHLAKIRGKRNRNNFRELKT